VSTFVAIILLFFVAVPIGQALAKLIEARAAKPPLSGEPEQAGRLDEIEKRVRYLTEQVEGLQENHEFLTSLLESRSSSALPAHSEE
jgi:hypothetical protein